MTNSAPIINSNGGGASASISVSENGTAVTTVVATDVDAGTTLVYSISGGVDAAKFTINSSTGVLTFIGAPNYESATDSGANNVYDVIVKVSDGSLFDTQSIAVTVTNVNEAPTVTSAATASVAENSTTVMTVTGTDPDAGTTLTYSISGGVDSAKFTINSSTGALSFVSAPNYESPTDSGANNVYDVTVQVSDGTLTATKAVAVTVTNVNEAPTVTSAATANVGENSTAVMTVTGSDPDAGATLTYSINGGANSAKFTINSSTGALSFVSAPNYESPTDSGADNVYNVTVQVSDGTLTSTKAVAVTVTNVNEAPTVTSAATASVAENSTAVMTVTGSDPDAGTALTYSINGGVDAAKFTINSSTGALSFVSAPNYESPTDSGTNNVYNVTVQVSDGTLTATKAIAVTVTNINEAPTVTSAATASAAENGTAVMTVTGSDQDAGTTLTYSISGGSDAAKFTINSTTGALSFVSAPNYESPTDTGADNVYNVTVQVSDGSLTSTKDVAVTVTNVNEAPVITSGGGGDNGLVSVAENLTVATTVVAADPDSGTTLTYSIAGGADAAKFTIDASTGVLSFVSAPDFETPTDAGANNIYDVTVRVSDGTLTDTQNLSVSVTNLNDNAPVITSNGGGDTAAVSVAENTSTVTTVTATDADAGAQVFYSITGGADAAKFTINSTTGELSFVTAPDYEKPTDAGKNNVYDVIVRASNGTLTDNQAIAVTVTDVAAVTINGTAGADVIDATQTVAGQPLPTAENDTLLGLGGNDSLDGGVGADTMNGGIGNDTYYVDNTGDKTLENAGEGTDTVRSTVTYTLSANVENLKLTGTGLINGTGNTLNNNLDGNGAANVLDGGTGADTMTGGNGNDTYVVDNAGDVVIETDHSGTDTIKSSITIANLAAFVENLTLTGSTALDGTGNSLDNTLTGNSAANTLSGLDGNDKLDGGAGADHLVGGLGNDTYVVDNASDIVTELTNEGTDIILSSITISALAANVENLTLTGSGVIDGTGNALDNEITGNGKANVLTGLDGNDWLKGSSGADTMYGGIGDDTYDVDSNGDVTFENGPLHDSEGTDTVRSSITWTLGTNLENLTLIGLSKVNGYGNSSDNIITGNIVANTLYGYDGNDTLDGGRGGDKMFGGAGNDIYYVNETTDVVTELANEGTDSVVSTITYTLGVNLENLTLTGTSGINGTGNAFDNIIIGNLGTNTLTGGAGNDTYYIQNSFDSIIENVNEGTDIVYSSVTHMLETNVENLTLTGTLAADATGNSLNNTLVGNSGENILDGQAGADSMAGGAFNDTYIVDNVGDTVTELANEGTDSVQSSIAYTLGANVENLTLTGSSTIDGTGNSLDNSLEGNSADNVLTGGAGIDALYGSDGNDTINGGTGADFLTGGFNNDTFVFSSISDSGTVDGARDIVTDFSSGLDIINLSAIDANLGVSGDQAFVLDTNGTFVAGEIAFTQVGSDLYVSLYQDSSGVAAMQFVVLSATSLSASDFVL